MPKQKQPKKADEIFQDVLLMEDEAVIALFQMIKSHLESKKQKAKELAEKLEKI